MNRAMNDLDFEEDCYWRKFHELHNWMTMHYSNGEENDCTCHIITNDVIIKLNDIFEKIMPFEKYLVKDTEDNKTEDWSWDYFPSDYEYIKDETICEKLDNILRQNELIGRFSPGYDREYFDLIKRSLDFTRSAVKDIKDGKIKEFVYLASW